MTAPGWDDDERLLDELHAALRAAGPPTPSMVAAGRAAFSWESIDAELAALTHDSLRDGLPGVRGNAAPPRTLVFSGAEVSVELGLTGTGLVGQLVPPTSGEIGLWSPGGELAAATADELGCFDVPVPRSGLVRLRCRTSSGELVTDWFRV
ncbi:hypothetical protein [Modestobacter marinus]|uniref:hypothetical protein n=1 Tax=Modestobacter marinus TaxID=477641 RepID=UPI001C95DB2C|nr:hypothetical protein [Modestobacter marinus]